MKLLRDKFDLIALAVIFLVVFAVYSANGFPDQLRDLIAALGGGLLTLAVKSSKSIETAKTVTGDINAASTEDSL
jgi:hypothetical protein